MFSITKNDNFRYNLTININVIVLPILAAIILFVYIFISFKQWDSIKSAAQTALDKAAIYINNEIDSYLDSSIAIATNRELNNVLKTRHDSGLEARVNAANSISNFMSIIPAKTEFPTPFVIYTENPTLYPTKYIMNLDDLEYSDIISMLTEHKYSYIYWDENPFVYYILFSETEQITNILRTEINTPLIDSYIQNASGKDFYVSLDDSRNKYDTMYSSALRNNSNLYAIIPFSSPATLFITNGLIALSAFFVLGYMFCIIIMYICRKMTNDIYQFIDDINNHDYLINQTSSYPQHYKEFMIIKDKITELLLSIQNLHTQLKTEEEKRQKIELEVLQSKFNPHLLYNTLSVIKWNSMRGTTDKIVPLVDFLTRYYRTLLNHDTIVTLNEEIFLVEQYIRIMEYAHSNTYNLQINIDESMKTFPILKHTLQPLAENAILHGFNQRQNNIISICAFRNNETAIIKVRDNGYGIPSSKIEELTTDTYTSTYKSYGVRNTRNSLLLLFGKENFDFSIASVLNEYTEITLSIRIPDKE